MITAIIKQRDLIDTDTPFNPVDLLSSAYNREGDEEEEGTTEWQSPYQQP